MNTDVAYPVLGVYLILVLGAGIWGAIMNVVGVHSKDRVREHFLAGHGLGTFVWLFTMMATLFSGYSVSGIVNEAYNQGWIATRWIPGGVGLYIAFGFMAPRIHALSKRRNYFTISQVLFDRYMSPSSRSNLVAHAVHILSFLCLQLPVFTYLITQFQSIGIEVRTFTGGEINATTAVLVSAGVLLICDLLGGMRAVAFTDVLQGIVLVAGSIIFLVVQKTELGGLSAAQNFWGNPANFKKLPKNVFLVEHVPAEQSIVAYFDFVFKTTVAATMFPHLTARLFAARNAFVIRRGMSIMVFMFFIVQLSSMITGWVGIYALYGKIQKGQSAFGALLQLVADEGTGQAVLAALLLASAICAMMSTADSAMLACASMWVRDVYVKYFRKKASNTEQILFGKFIGTCALITGVTLGLYTIEHGKPDLSSLFALQNVTPIHVAPGVWLGLHWRRLRGEAVLTGMVAGLSVTLGLAFSKYNIKKAVGSDMLECGLSSAWVGFCANLGLTVLLGLAMQFWPRAFGLRPIHDDDFFVETDSVDDSSEGDEGAKAITDVPPPPAIASADKAKDEDAQAPVPAEQATETGCFARSTGAVRRRLASMRHGTVGSDAAVTFTPAPLDIGPKKDRILNPYLWTVMFLLLLFTVPFYRVPMSWDGYVGAIGAWPFTSLLLSGILAICGSIMFTFFWEDYQPWSFAGSRSARNALDAVTLVVNDSDNLGNSTDQTAPSNMINNAPAPDAAPDAAPEATGKP